jgi:putative aminopeptidase FrvX
MFDEPFFLVNKFGIDGEMTILTKEGIRTATISIHANNPLFKEI